MYSLWVEVHALRNIKAGRRVAVASEQAEDVVLCEIMSNRQNHCCNRRCVKVDEKCTTNSVVETLRPSSREESSARPLGAMKPLERLPSLTSFLGHPRVLKVTYVSPLSLSSQSP